MKEICELRINKRFAHLLPSTIVCNDLGPVVKIQIDKNTTEFEALKVIAAKIKNSETESFFYGWGIKRKYTKDEFANAQLLHLIVGNVFEPTGEDCGTIYDESTSCEICGANRKQNGFLKLKKNTIPKKDIAITIAGEIVVSEKFVKAFNQRHLKGLKLLPIEYAKVTSDYYQLFATSEIELSENTISGINPFDLSISSEEEIYKCPKGHTIGLNLLSEPYVLSGQSLSESDFFVSKQKIGIKRGLLRPEPIYFCSQDFRKMVEEEKLNGFEFEITRIE